MRNSTSFLNSLPEFFITLPSNIIQVTMKTASNSFLSKYQRQADLLTIYKNFLVEILT